MAICDYLSSLHADCVFDSPMQDIASVLHFPISTDLEGVPQDPGQQFSIQYQYSLTSVNLHNYLNLFQREMNEKEPSLWKQFLIWK